jgi:hypothetical protein
MVERAHHQLVATLALLGLTTGCCPTLPPALGAPPELLTRPAPAPFTEVAAAPPPAPSASARPTTGPTPPKVQRALVLLDAGRHPAKLIRVTRERGEEVACDAPCNRVLELPEKAWFYVASPRSQATMLHQLYSPEDPVVWMKVRPTSTLGYRALHVSGIAAAAIGGALVLGALISIPWAKESQDGIHGAMFTGVAGILLTPSGGMMLLVSDVFLSHSELTFIDPRTRPDLKIHF